MTAMRKIKIGVVGFGKRGKNLLECVLLPMCEDRMEINAVCDLYTDRADWAADTIEEKTGLRPFVTLDYRDILTREDIEAVVITSAWESHIDIAVAAMKAGKYVGMEVGGAYTVEECWRLVNTFEETGTYCMLLENCCYGKRELMALNMARMGVLGNIVHCSGGYCHDLRYEVANGNEIRHYRLRNYMNRCCENYPTHEIGPIAKLLNINNGNRMISLTSTASCAKGLHDYIIKEKGGEHPLADVEFAQGDIVTTVIKCAKGQTITITLDTTLPRSYSRGFTVRGTKGAYFEDTDSLFLDSEHREYEFNARGLWGNAEKYEEQYQHPLWRDYIPQGGHDGMDWMEFCAFTEAVRENKRPPIDVYDAAAYMVITALSEQSIACGGAPMAIPDFTRGRWTNRDDIKGDDEYALDIEGINKKYY